MSIQRITDLLINSGIEEQEAKYEIKLLLKYLFNYSEIDKIKGSLLSKNELELLEEKIIDRIKNHIPVQYIIGKSWFMGEDYIVTPDVLIPRDETEMLVKKAIEIINNNNFEDVLDIGTGSGCIACSIAKNTKATILGVDISTSALRVALDNVTQLGLNNRALFIKSNLLENIRAGESFDIIVSNPPYIPSGTILSEEVQKEPSIALYAEENGLEFYRKIINSAPEYLNENGYLIFELGIGEAELVKELMDNNFENISIEKDLANIERIIWGQKK